MTPIIRSISVADAAECGRIIHSAFAAIAEQHNFPHDFPSAEGATGLTQMPIAAPGFYGVVAERDGHV
jgi:hypothetical protein